MIALNEKFHRNYPPSSFSFIYLLMFFLAPIFRDLYFIPVDHSVDVFIRFAEY